jgi:hypothetical protein
MLAGEPDGMSDADIDRASEDWRDLYQLSSCADRKNAMPHH